MGLFSRLFGSSDTDDREETLERYIGDTETRENIVETTRNNPGTKMEYGYFLIWCRDENGPIYTAPSEFMQIPHEPPIEADEPDPHTVVNENHLQSIRNKLDENFNVFYDYHDVGYYGSDSFALYWLRDDTSGEFDTKHTKLHRNEDTLEITFREPISGEPIESAESMYSFTSPIDIPRDDNGDLQEDRLEKILHITVFEHIYHHPHLEF